MRDYTLYFLIEKRPDGSESEIWLGTELKGGKRVNYTVHGAVAYHFKKKWEEMHPEYKYEVRIETD